MADGDGGFDVAADETRSGEVRAEAASLVAAILAGHMDEAEWHAAELDRLEHGH